ncbi:putative toxin-antitoxin system toxin component, PIN family [Caloramator quimbayensis]|uniref:Putative toxin-antitoxin system toxin component, PIN family n=1 Tax=Caloramator quimbayensis TaxID=1147123 RepID=A0A1T4YJ68_9CLOT|nr:putative toxin-antitoxin system toxin component, PIN family [Caloramator quimbayensis]SKB01311.1 putative toxin-antitoxin system toxin component, PIN family [Caloramator quimbayensis]
MELILDACTLIKGMIQKSGPERQLVDYIQAGDAKLVVSQEAITEYIYAPYKIFVEAIRSGRIKDYNRELNNAYYISNRLAKILNYNSRLVNVYSKVNIIEEDEADNKFINLAIDSKIYILVSNDTHITGIKDKLLDLHNIEVLSPMDAVFEISKQKLKKKFSMKP